MNKLFKLREWLTLDETAAHISNVLGEPVTVSDLYRLALDGHLTLSVDFVNHAFARKGKWVKTEDIEFVLKENDFFTGEKLAIPYRYPLNHEIKAYDDDWIALEDSVVTIDGIWDLTMVGAEKMDIENDYQQLISGVEVTLIYLEGMFLQQGDVVCQLQESFDKNEYQEGSKAQQKEMERSITAHSMGEDEAKRLRDKFKVNRAKFLKKRESQPVCMQYYPSPGLAQHDCVQVIRTKEITRFIQSLEDLPAPEKPLTSKERNSLLVLIGALCKEVGIDPNKRGVASSLVAMTEILGAPLTDDTIRKILSQIDDSVSARNK